MNKKSVCLLSIFTALLLLASCGATDNWQKIEIAGIGSIKVPRQWEYSVIDGFIYLSSDESGESKNVLIQYRDNGNINNDFADIEDFEWLEDVNYSNSASLSKKKVHYKDGSTAEMFVLRFDYPDPDNYVFTEFLCLDDSVSEDALKKITKSFVMRE